jgi:uncharacterized protein YeaO (DUF488 family)
MSVAVKRIYERPSRADGARVLVDRLWPRGLSKANAVLHEWMRNLAPSDALRKWFDSQPGHWQSFRRKYLQELSEAEAEPELRRLYALAHKRKRVTLLFASRNETHNNAVVLKELLEGMRKPPAGTGPAGTQAVRRRATRRN